ncbi:MAG TPA: dihydrolipoamide acetyltransferase family protein [Bacteroidia bacterium]|nr:dihydrolipoamide acetyltransferase family protein [Bacteroidia bacterium]HRH07388.1 dihydrolipoamide acetyltransferase family protein [Bacteroidia bacterium]
MAQFEMIMPKMGESVAEATIIKWLKSEGDTIDADESVLEIATDKVDSEVPAPSGGILVKRMFQEGDVVKVGAVIALLSSDASVAASAPAPAAPAQSSINVPVNAPVAQVVAQPAVQDFSKAERFYSPLVKNIAKQEGISLAELEKIPGSGAEGRVTKQDILDYLPVKGQVVAAPIVTEPIQPAVAPAPKAKTETPVAAVSLSGGDEIIEMDRMRKMIAEHMVMSKHTSPHVTSYVEADVTNLVMWRNKIKSGFEKRENEKITFTPVFIEAVAKAIKDFPMINISVDGTKIIVKKNINIGMATALPSGNLIVPVIKNADQKNLLGLTKSVNDLANRARMNKLVPDEISGGTFTITNVGSFGNVMGTPIINQPQVAILAVGAIKKKPAVIETEQGDAIAIRHLMFLSLSYDHRVVDGSLGGRFVRKVADYLEAFDITTPI